MDKKELKDNLDKQIIKFGKYLKTPSKQIQAEFDALYKKTYDEEYYIKDVILTPNGILFETEIKTISKKLDWFRDTDTLVYSVYQLDKSNHVIKEVDFINNFLNTESISVDEVDEVEDNSFKMTWLDASFPPTGGRYWCVVEEQNDLGLSKFQWNCDYNPNDKRWSDGGESMVVTHYVELPPMPVKK